MLKSMYDYWRQLFGSDETVLLYIHVERSPCEGDQRHIIERLMTQRMVGNGKGFIDGGTGIQQQNKGAWPKYVVRIRIAEGLSKW